MKTVTRTSLQVMDMFTNLVAVIISDYEYVIFFNITLSVQFKVSVMFQLSKREGVKGKKPLSKTKQVFQKDTYTHNFTTALSTIAKTQNNLSINQ